MDAKKAQLKLLLQLKKMMEDRELLKTQLKKEMDLMDLVSELDLDLILKAYKETMRTTWYVVS